MASGNKVVIQKLLVVNDVLYFWTIYPRLLDKITKLIKKKD